MKMKKDVDIIRYSEIFKALAHPTRLAIAYGLMFEESCNVSKMCKCLQISQPTISQHLNILKNAHIITGFRKGNTICYKIDDSYTINILKQLKANK